MALGYNLGRRARRGKRPHLTQPPQGYAMPSTTTTASTTANPGHYCATCTARVQLGALRRAGKPGVHAWRATAALACYCNGRAQRLGDLALAAHWRNRVAATTWGVHYGQLPTSTPGVGSTYSMGVGDNAMARKRYGNRVRRAWLAHAYRALACAKGTGAYGKPLPAGTNGGRGNLPTWPATWQGSAYQPHGPVACQGSAPAAPLPRAVRALCALRAHGLPAHLAVPLANAMATPHVLPHPGTVALAQQAALQPARYMAGARLHAYSLRCVQALAQGSTPAVARYL